MNLQELRQRSFDLIERAISEIEQRDMVEYNQVQSIEKIVKILDILEEAKDRAGISNPMADSATEELESMFEE